MTGDKRNGILLAAWAALALLVLAAASLAALASYAIGETP